MRPAVTGPSSSTIAIKAPEQTVEEELDEAGEVDAEERKSRERQREMINALDLKK